MSCIGVYFRCPSAILVWSQVPGTGMLAKYAKKRMGGGTYIPGTITQCRYMFYHAGPKELSTCASCGNFGQSKDLALFIPD